MPPSSNSKTVLKSLGLFLFIIHLGLWLWSAGGMAEWLLQNVPWPAYSNPDFPRWLLFFHWLAVIFTSTGFLYGYLARWKLTPTFMIFGYAFMSLICIVETFGYMTSAYKYLAMIAEFSAYIIILFILHNHRFRSMHFFE